MFSATFGEGAAAGRLDRVAARPFRFGVNLLTVGDRQRWADKCRLAEQLGFDVILVPDHLGAPAPFPALVAAAAVTERPRLGTFVLNAAFWNPALLAREIATVDQLTGGRLELGLGTGYVRSEFESAGLPWGSARSRVDRLATTVATLLDADPGPSGRRPPLLLGGQSDPVLTLAARHADIVAFTGASLVPGSADGALRLVGATALAERVAYFDTATGLRAAEIEKNLLVQLVLATDDRRGAVEWARTEYGIDYLGVDELLELPTLLVGTVRQMLDQLYAARDRFGLSYICIPEPSMTAFAPIISHLTRSP